MTGLHNSKGKTVICFEPNIASFRVLLRNVAWNEYHSQITPIFGAVGASRKIGNVYGGGQTSSLLPNRSGVPTYSHPIVVYALDDMVDATPVSATERILVKIDVEGGEYDVLRGADRLLRRHPPPVWIVENSLSVGGAVNTRFIDVFKRFWDMGYTVRDVDRLDRIVTPADASEWLRCRRRSCGSDTYCCERPE